MSNPIHLHHDPMLVHKLTVNVKCSGPECKRNATRTLYDPGSTAMRKIEVCESHYRQGMRNPTRALRPLRAKPSDPLVKVTLRVSRATASRILGDAPGAREALEAWAQPAPSGPTLLDALQVPENAAKLSRACSEVAAEAAKLLRSRPSPVLSVPCPKCKAGVGKRCKGATHGACLERYDALNGGK